MPSLRTIKPMDTLSASLSALPQVPHQKTAVEPMTRTNTISNRVMQGVDKFQSVRGNVVNSTTFSNFTMRRIQSQVVPESPVDKRARESSVSRATAVSEFILFLKIMDEVAIHHITLYFININTLAVILKMEKSFTKYYASSQRKIYLRGLLTLIGFMISTFVYDYFVLWEDFSVGTTATAEGVVSTKLPKFTIVVVLKLAVVLPLLLLTFFRARKHPYHEDFKLTWLCICVVACYPVVYNKITNDYGVSWVCLVIMYVYSCTPIRFFQVSIFCLGYLATYVVVMLAYVPGSSDSSASSSRQEIANETLYACLFFFLILLPSQSREFAIRVSYMSELMVLLQQEQLKMEETRSKALLNSMLPESIVVQLQCGRELIADEYAEATVLFAEVCDFDLFSSKLQPQQVVELLNILFYKFDKLVDVHHVHKVETIGAVYMVVGGCPDVITNHAELVANLALDMIRCIPEVSAKIARKNWGHMVTNLNIRVGINSGGLMAGVVGIRNPRFKLFGDTVNVASRMETTNLPGQIQITEATHNAIYHKFHTALRGKVFVKGRGEMDTYFLRGKDGYIVPPASVVNGSTTEVVDSGTASTSTSPTSGRRRTSRMPGASINAIPEHTKTEIPTPPALPSIPAKSNPSEESFGALPTISKLPNARQPRRTSRLGTLDLSNKQATIANLLALAPPPGRSSSIIQLPEGTKLPSIPQSGREDTMSPSQSLLVLADQPLSPSSAPRLSKRRGTVSALRGHSLSQIATVRRSLFRENIFDIVEDIDANGDPECDENVVFSATIMTLPKGLTRTEVLFRVHGNRTGFRSLTKETYEFEESYRVENRARWLWFLRLSVSVFLVLKPFLTLYQTIRLSTVRSFEQSEIIFLLNFCIMYPIMVSFLVYTFSPNFSNWEQSASVFVISVVAVILCTESLATNSLGHAYMSALALYQCYFANLSFLLRVVNGFEILALYLLANLLIAPYFDWEVNATQLRILRNALYIFLFFAGQAWVVFNSEFKQRINHYRDITLNSQKQKLVEEEARITKLLLNLLPETIVHKLKEDPQTTIADFFDNVTVLFTDMVNFTAYSSKVSAMELVQFLNDMYTRFDTIAEREVLYKVEIIGDAYFVVGGCPIVNTNNALSVVTAATDMFAALPLLRRNCGVPDLNIRIGVHSGPVLAGVVGSKDPRYHLFGDTVSIAHFLESSGVPGRIHISESTWASMNKETPGHGFKVEYHTLLSINGSSKKLRTYFVL
ncbi:Guanylate cyclase soluble subunit beta-2 [Phytophthora citrophthora]|uniref:adenylate cyclase n=1 Tax=Phytophthora citrophthora TaxID=4793 RepID=A0AAD9G5R7_9STRA|nr:Guanylate cyclase soluble subunit beta-2 [Phytophthora citrophthora]